MFGCWALSHPRGRAAPVSGPRTGAARSPTVQGGGRPCTRPPASASGPDVEWDVPAGTCRWAVTDEPADSLLPGRLHGAGASGPGAAPARGHSPLAVTLAINAAVALRRLRLTRRLAPSGYGASLS